MVAKKKHNFFDNVGRELGIFFTKTIPKTTHNIGGFIGGIGHDLHEDVKDIIHLPDRIIKGVGTSGSQLIKQVGTSGSQITTSVIGQQGIGNAINQASQGVGGLLQSSTLPLLIAGGSIIGFTLLNRR